MARLDPQYVVSSLVQRGVPEHVARGVVMNFQDESGLDTGIQEHAPISGRGGFGLAQWTGPRRVALEDFARSQGKSIDDPEAQLDFFMMENAGPEAAAWKQVMASPTAQDAAVAFVNKWERPASQNANKRTAKYINAEGAGHFGGTGLDGSQPASTGPAVAAAPASPYALQKPAPKDKYAAAISKGIGAIGGMAGSQGPALGDQGAAPQLPMAPMMSSEAMPIVSGGGGDDNRNALALLLARLNKNTLWG